MSVTPTLGELLVGAYHRVETECEVVSYNNRSDESGNQMEADILAIDNQQDGGSGQHIFVCEVVTHLSGDLYSGSPNDTDGWWMEYSNTPAYHRSLEKLWEKFMADHQYVKTAFPFAERYSFEFWAPVVTGGQNNGYLIQGLNRLQDEFKEETGEGLELVINEKYSSKVKGLKEEAVGDTKQRGAPAYRFLQILGNLE
jgi:hypothetical protein